MLMKFMKPSTLSAAVSGMMMKAVVQNGYGAPESVLSLVDNVPRPTLPDEKSVLVRVMSTSVNTPDWAGTLGFPYLLRLGSGLFRPKKNRILGSDVAGVVEQVGSEVTDLQPGDAVFGATANSQLGCFAEYVTAKPQDLCRKPKSMSFDKAAACVMSGVTALNLIRDGAKANENKHILINGASGSVGTFAIQIAKAMGATVTAVCSGENSDLVRSLGADHVIDYTKTDYTAATDQKYDVIVDNVMNRSFKENARVLKNNGYVIPNSIGPGRGNWFGSIPSFIVKPSDYPVVECRVNRDNLRAVSDMVESGKVHVTIDKVFTLDEASTAVAYMASHRAKGNVVIRVSDAT